MLEETFSKVVGSFRFQVGVGIGFEVEKALQLAKLSGVDIVQHVDLGNGKREWGMGTQANIHGIASLKMPILAGYGW